MAQIYRKVSLEVKPKAKERVGDVELKGFIEKCTGKSSDLLKNQFLSEVEFEQMITHFSSL